MHIYMLLCFAATWGQSQIYVEQYVLQAALGCVGAVVDPLALPCFGEDKRESGQSESFCGGGKLSVKTMKIVQCSCFWHFVMKTVH